MDLTNKQPWHDAVALPAAGVPELLDLLPITQVLVVGGQVGRRDGIDVRESERPPGFDLRGCVAFKREPNAWAAVVADGASSDGAEWAKLESVDGSHPIAAARRWFEFLWRNAARVGPPPAFSPGDAVRLAGAPEVWIVRGADQLVGGEWQYSLSRELTQTTATETGLEKVDLDDRDPRSWLQQAPADAAALALSLAYVKLSNPLTDTVYAYQSTKTVFRAYQFRPLLRLLSSPHQRLLIADEVGLGKTIEAGLVWTEMDQRIDVRRALVVCPSTLVHKWVDELRRRFDRRVRAIKRSDLPDLVDHFKQNDQAPLQVVASLEMLRTAKELTDLVDAAPKFDLIIVDEAHYLRNGGTRSHALGQLLSDWADVLLFLSATPLNLGREDLYSLLNLLAEEEFSDPAVFVKQMEPNRYLNTVAKEVAKRGASPRQLRQLLRLIEQTEYGALTARKPEFGELDRLLDRDTPLGPGDIATARRHLTELNTLAGILTRTRKADTKERKVVRVAEEIGVAWTEPELALYQAAQNWARRRALQQNGVVGFATQMPLRQAASCLPAFRKLVRRRHAELAYADEDLDDVTPVDIRGSAANDESIASAESDATVAESTLEAAEVELRDALRSLGDVDTKFDQFAIRLEELLRRDVSQVMVFSFFRGTLAYLEQRLSDLGYSVKVMDGSTRMDERISLMARFRQGGFQILLLSEVGSEGLDFEFCQALVNYDLPWNPMRVEQRIGRIDRFGSPYEKVFILNFHVPGTIETDIFERLYDRINVFEESIGELEPILRSGLTDLTRAALDPRLTDEQRADEVHRVTVAIAQQRKDLEDIESAEGFLSGVDQLLIDGFERDTRESGRFVGPPELRTLLRTVMQGTGARLRGDGRRRPLELVGTEDFRDRVVATGVTSGASRYGHAELLALLNDGTPIPITFDNEEAARVGTELLSLRHPLVVAAVRYVESNRHLVHRYASVSVEGSEDGSYLVALWIAQTTGLRPALELWPVAVDLESGKIDDRIGDLLLRSAAEGKLADGVSPGMEEVALRAFDVAEQFVYEKRRGLEGERRRLNEVLVDSRIKAREDAIDLKVDRARRSRSEATNAQIRRLYEGRIRNLGDARAAIRPELERSRGLTISLEPVALVVLAVRSGAGDAGARSHQ